MIVIRVFTAMALNSEFDRRRLRQDARALVGGVARVQHQHRNVLLDGGQHGRRVQDLRAEIGELRRLFEADHLDPVSIGTDTRVGGLHAVDVGPDLDTLGVQPCTDQGGGEIGASAADGGGNSLAGGADKATHDGDASCIDQRFYVYLKALIDLLDLRYGARVLAIGDDDLSRICQGGGNLARQKRRCDYHAGQPLAEGDDVIGGSRRELTDGGDAAQ